VAGAKKGGLHFIRDLHENSGSMQYSLSDIAPNDVTGGANYVGKELSIDLFKHIHDLPVPLRTDEMMLRSVEALLTNLLNDKFDNGHYVLEQFCEHVSMSLNDLQQRKRSCN